MNFKVFICYRRSDSIVPTGRIYDHLIVPELFEEEIEVFEKAEVFRDLQNIEAGEVFPKVINDALTQSQVVLVVIGDKWLNIKDREGNCRLKNPKDWVRKEIEFALKGKDKGEKEVIPLLLDQTSMPKADDLDKSLKQLSVLNPIRIRYGDPDFKEDIKKTIAFIKRKLEELNDADSKRTLDDANNSESSNSIIPGLPGRRIFIFLTVSTALMLLRNWLTLTEKTSDIETVEIVKINPAGDITNRYRKQIPIFLESLGNGINLELVNIPQGVFWMGATNKEEGFLKDEEPQHKVTISNPFWMSKYAITQRQWKTVASLQKVNIELNPDPSKFKGDERPVERVSWYEAIEFCHRLTKQTGHLYRLPSESEWEYACRGNTKTPFYFGPIVIPTLANYNSNFAYANGPTGGYRRKTIQSGLFPPNTFGLYDMHGNVWEWCLDHEHNNYRRAPADGSAWIVNGNITHRIARGGSWISHPKKCRAAARAIFGVNAQSEYIGFRIVSTDQALSLQS
ncbi:MAG: SUMF1/EgtB/PvdO family nonheme iron enzyme [Cyanobacteria bacterium P01_F01_bin.13]